MLSTGSGSSFSRDSLLVWEYFQRRTEGIFVDVGANHPIKGNQTWLLECKGWSGILIEPNPDLCQLLREQRPRSRVFEAAVCAPVQEGHAELHLAVDPAKSSLRPEWDHAQTGKTVSVPTRTLNAMLAEGGIGQIDLLSLDVEGMELEALRGLDFHRHRPQLILIEDHFYDYQKHFYLRRLGYKLVKRTHYNNWYVPRSAAASLWSMSGLRDSLKLGRKMWLNTPFNNLRRRLKQRKKAAR